MENQLQLDLYEQEDGTHQLALLAPTGVFPMTASDVSNLIAGLADTRTNMTPAISMDPPPIPGMQNVADDPPIRWAYDEMNDRVALVMRHPGHGWLGYSLPMQTVEALQLGLQQITDHRTGQLRQRPN